MGRRDAPVVATRQNELERGVPARRNLLQALKLNAGKGTLPVGNQKQRNAADRPAFTPSPIRHR
jgi:hypothetical protein